MIHWSSGREGHNNYRWDLVIWLVPLIYSAVGFVLGYNYVILNYCIRFAVSPCIRLFLNSSVYGCHRHRPVTVSIDVGRPFMSAAIQSMRGTCVESVPTQPEVN